MPGFLVRVAGQGPDGSLSGGGGASFIQAKDLADALVQAADIFKLDVTQVTAEPYESSAWNEIK